MGLLDCSDVSDVLDGWGIEPQNFEGALGADDLFGYQGNRKGCPYS